MGPVVLVDADGREEFNGLGVVESLGRSLPFLRVELCTVLLLSLGILTWQQTAVYHDLITLYTTTLAQNPGCWMAHYNLGFGRGERGGREQVISHYRRAMAIRERCA